MSIVKISDNIENYDVLSIMNEQVFKHSYFGVLPVFIKGRYYYFLLDSGANNNVLCSSAFERHPEFKTFEVIKQNKFIAAGDTEETISNVVVADIVIGDYNVKCPFQCIDLSLSFDDILEDCNIEVIGIIGFKFMNHFKLIIDFESLMVYNKRKEDMNDKDFIHLSDELYLRPLISINNPDYKGMYKLKGKAISINNKNLEEDNAYCLILDKKIKITEGKKIPNSNYICKQIHHDIDTGSYLIEIEGSVIE